MTLRSTSSLSFGSEWVKKMPRMTLQQFVELVD